MKVQRAYSWLLALLIPAFAVQIALANPIEEHAYDAAAFHIYRGVVFSDARADGVLYPRWVSEINAGLGGPLFSFYSPLVYFGMDSLHWLGFSHPVAWRALVALSLILASLGMFLLGLSLFKRADLALVTAAAFTYAPYLLRDFFQRGAPQGMAIALYPWLLWSLVELVERPSGWRFAFTAICWAAIALLHNLSAALILPIVGLFCVFLAIKNRGSAEYHRNGAFLPFPPLAAAYSRTGKGSGIEGLSINRKNPMRTLWLPIAALIAGLLLSAFHVLPFVLESKYVQLAGASGDMSMQPAANPVAANDLLGLPAIFDTGLDNNATGEDVGILHVLAMLAGIVVAILLWRCERSVGRWATGLDCPGG